MTAPKGSQRLREAYRAAEALPLGIIELSPRACPSRGRCPLFQRLDSPLQRLA
jgi:hypothetical protein